MTPLASVPVRASSFSPLPKFCCADAPFTLLLLACAAAAICFSVAIEPCERRSLSAAGRFAGGILLQLLMLWLIENGRV